MDYLSHYPSIEVLFVTSLMIGFCLFVLAIYQTHLHMQKNRLIKSLRKDLAWSKTQCDMIIADVKTFKDASAELRQTALSMALDINKEKDIAQSKLQDQLREDYDSGALPMN